MAEPVSTEVVESGASVSPTDSGILSETPIEPPAPVTATTDTPKKSWASLVRGTEGPKPPGNAAVSASSMKRPTITPYVITSEDDKRHREREKLSHLGEVMFGKDLMNREIDHRTIYLTPRGMINRGNACYANAVLQTLVFCPPFFRLMEALDVGAGDFDGMFALLPPVSACFAQLIKEFNKIPTNLARKSQLGREEAPLDPSFVYETLEQHGTTSQQQMLSKGNQEDAQEFLNHVLLLLHEEMVRGMGFAEKNSSSDGSKTAGNGSDEWININKNQKKSIVRAFEDLKDSPISRLFCGKLRSTRKQHGAKDFGSVEPFFMLDLPIQDARVRNVFSALEQFMRPENLQGFQDRGRTVQASRHYQFELLPAVLILHLKYFEFSSDGGLAKLQKPVDFEPVLRLPERWFAAGHFQASRAVYKLSAVVFHYGEGTEGGHYTACLFHPSSPGQWIEANDSLISVVSFDYMRRTQPHRVPYLLFYRLQPPEF